MSQQKEQLLTLIDKAKSLEFILLDSVGENQETISTLEQLAEIAEQARTKLSQLSTLHLRIAEVQPTISNDLLKLMNEAITSGRLHQRKHRESNSCVRAESRGN